MAEFRIVDRPHAPEALRHLWVTESLRGHGHGRRMLEAAETLATERGCLHVFLESFSFQAPALLPQAPL